MFNSEVNKYMPMLNLGVGVSMNYSVKGAGVPIIFIHPPVLSSINFIYQIDALSYSC